MDKLSVKLQATPRQRDWLDWQKRRRNLPITTLLLLALERAMKADPMPKEGGNERS